MLIMNFLKKDNALAVIEKNLKEGYYKKALNLSLKYVNENPNDFLIKFYIAQAYEGLKEIQLAIQYFEKASITASLSSQDDIKTQIFLKIAELYKKTKRFNEALGYYVLALEKDPKNSKALLSASELLFEMKNYKKAKDYLESAIKIKPDNLRARFILAKVYIFLNYLQDAANQLEYILQNIKVNDEVLIANSTLLLADVFLSLKNYQKAIQTLKPFLENSDQFESILNKIIEIYIKMGQTRQAVEMANSNMNRVSKQKEAEILYLIAAAYFKEGDIYRAVKIWEEAFKKNPVYKDLKNLVNRYLYIIHNPSLEPLFSKNEGVFGEFAIKLLKVPYIKQTIKKDTFWAFESGEKSYVIYKRPYPIPTSELIEVQRVINQNFKANTLFTLYSLYGITNDTNTSNTSYNANKMELVADSDFINSVNGVFSNNSPHSEN